MTYILIFILSFILTYLIKNYAIKKSLIADVNERSSHTVPTPHGGGIAIAVSFYLGLFYLKYNNFIEPKLFNALCCGILLSVVSFLDDIFELPPKLRLIIQVLVAISGLFFLGGLNSLNLFFFSINNFVFNNIFSALLIVWYINLYNFLDGINGYAGSEAVFLSIAGYIVFGGEHFLILSVSVLGFLFWNWNNAKIFMGDVGSTLLGYIVAIWTIYYANQNSSNLWIWVLLFSVFWFDATLTLFRRFKNGERLSQAHKKHAYQRLIQAGWSHFKATNFSIVLNILLFFIAYFISNKFTAFVFAVILLYLVVKYVDSKKGFK